MTTVSPLGKSLASWSKSRICGCVHRGQFGVDGVDIRLAQGVAGEVDLPQRVIARGDADGLAAQHHHRAARLEVLGIAGKAVGHRVIVPDHVAIQVGRQRC